MIHRLQLRAIIHSTENPDRVKKALGTVLPEGAEILKENIFGHYGNVMRVLTSTVKDKTEANRVLRSVLARLEPGERDTVKEELPRRIDDECCLHLRIDKQQAYAGNVRLARGDDCIYLRAKLECYPARHNAAVAVAGGLFNGT